MKVYIAGPYTKGDVAINVREAIKVGNRVAEEGHTPFVPHLTHFWHLIFPHGIEFWYQQDMEWLKECNAVIRLPGESNGADKEVRTAIKLGIPVYYSFEEWYAESDNDS